MQEKRPLSPREIKAIEITMRARGLPEEVVCLVCDDLYFGLSKEETDQYLRNSYSFEQMKIYSQALRSDLPSEVMELIATEKLSAQKMAVIVEFADKGIPVDTIRSALLGDCSAHALRVMLKKVWAELEKVKVKPETEGGYEYANIVLAEVREVVSNIVEQEKRYQRLNEKLEQFGAMRVDETEKVRMVQQLEEKDKQQVALKNQLSEAHGTIARLREENEILKRDFAYRGTKDEEQEQKNRDNMENSIQIKTNKKPECPLTSTVTVPSQHMSWNLDNSIEVEVQPKGNVHAVKSFFSLLYHKKKNDLVRLVTESELSAQQLAQIRLAIEKGLTEEQLKLLIHKKPSAEQMAEIIQIAIYENGREE